MKKTLKDYIEIALTLAIIAGLFMPYLYGFLPIYIMFQNSMELITVFCVTIPVLASIPFLVIIIFKEAFGESILKILKVIFLILYCFVIGHYFYGVYDSFNDRLKDVFEFIIAIPLSVFLLILTLKYSEVRSVELKNIFLSIMTLPFILYFVYAITLQSDDFEYGGYIISISFILLYIMAVYSIFKNRSVKKLVKPA